MVFCDHHFKSFKFVDLSLFSFANIALRGDTVALMGSFAATLYLI